jgi:hypothetical protein
MFMARRNGDERDAWAAERWADGWYLKDIAAQLDISVSNAHAAVERAMAAPREAKITAGERARAVQRAAWSAPTKRPWASSERGTSPPPSTPDHTTHGSSL